MTQQRERLAPIATMKVDWSLYGWAVGRTTDGPGDQVRLRKGAAVAFAHIVQGDSAQTLGRPLHGATPRIRRHQSLVKDVTGKCLVVVSALQDLGERV